MKSEIRNRQPAINLWLPVALYTAFIFWLSSKARPIPGIELFPQMDKICHFLEYAPLGLLWLRALGSGPTGKKSWRGLCLWAFLAAAATGAADEWYQRFVPIKETDLFDWTADLGGIALGQALYLLRVVKTP